MPPLRFVALASAQFALGMMSIHGTGCAAGQSTELDKLGALGAFLSEPTRKRKLLGGTCVRHKPWYAFHETPPLGDILRPKLLCKDITTKPRFWIDRTGDILPRHSTYYIAPKVPEHIDDLARYLNSEEVVAWLRAHSQRAANGYLRLQSSVLKKIPIPPELARILADEPALFQRIV